MGLALSVTAGWSYDVHARSTDDAGDCSYHNEEIFLIMDSEEPMKIEIRQGSNVLHTSHEITTSTKTGCDNWQWMAETEG